MLGATWYTPILDLLYPERCPVCSDQPIGSGFFCCPACFYYLPQTDFQYYPRANAIVDRLWGRVPLESGVAFFYFDKGGRVQSLVHALKYRGAITLCKRVGHYYGALLREEAVFPDLSGIVPVPLHWRKLHKRGYNQSEAFGIGLARALEVPLVANVLHRRRHRRSQTHKSRSDRIQNVMNAFEARKPLPPGHWLLVDDVLTTGATLEACAQALFRASPGIRLSVCTLALAVG